MTSVWPALCPPWNRTTTSACSQSQSTILPLPSSPHWAPTTTTFAIALTSHEKPRRKAGVEVEKPCGFSWWIETVWSRCNHAPPRQITGARESPCRALLCPQRADLLGQQVELHSGKRNQRIRHRGPGPADFLRGVAAFPDIVGLRQSLGLLDGHRRRFGCARGRRDRAGLTGRLRRGRILPLRGRRFGRLHRRSAPTLRHRGP